MRELDHHPEVESRYGCESCSDSGIHNETREYCSCPLGLQRCNTDKVAEMLRGAPFTDAMWTIQQATAKAERAIAAADKVLLIDRTQRAEAAKLNAEGRAYEMSQKCAELEREVAELRKDAWKPIETAPKDGSEIWVFNGEQGRMEWLENEEAALWIWCDDLLSDSDPVPEQPTHWMPLPAPPAASSAQDKTKGGNHG